MVALDSYGQTGCDCPKAETCGPCTGGLTTLTVRYTGGVILGSVTAVDGNNQSLSSGLLTENTITFYSNAAQDPNIPFGGGEVTVTARTILLLIVSQATIKTDCSEPIYQGSSYEDGDFIILGGASVGTVPMPLCCEPVDQPSNPPIISGCPGNIVVSANGSCEAVVNWTPPTAINNNCGNTDPANITGNHDTGDTFSLGLTTVTYTATDDYGNTAICDFTVEVIDDIAPTITSCPTNADVSVNSSCNFTIPSYTSTPTVSDNCGTVTLTQSPVAGTIISGHNTSQLITLTATDGAGNSSSCSFTITLKDNTAPAITSCPTNTDVFVDASCSYTIPAYTATVSDNCAATLTQSPVVGTIISGHNTSQLITLTATDGAGNSSSCSFIITLKDNIAPVITSCPTNADVFVDASCNYTIPTYTATVSDNCAATLTQSPVAGTIISGHNTSQLITLTATDGAGNSSSCSFTITLKDNTAPAITSCPTNTDVFVNGSCNYTIPTYTATVSDNCGTVTLTQSPVAGTVLSGHNTAQLITLTATDAAGNSSSCSFTITLKDNIAPTFNNCPPDIIRDALPSCRATATWTTPTVSDNCTSFPSLSTSHAAGAMFDFGVTVVTYTATDAAGNSSTCSFRVTVRNNSPPTFTGCPEDIRLEAGETGEVSATWTEPVISNTCGNVTVTASHAPGDLFPVGTTEVTYVATRDDGATASCTFQVIVAYQNVTFEVVPLITPNGDGIYDKLTVKNLESYSDNNVVIVDRWGGLIYAASGYNNESVAWDGTNKNGAQVPTGTYFYTITVVFRGQKTIKKGYIELVR